MNKINTLKKAWISETNTAIENIESLLYSTKEEYEMPYHTLINWITNTDINHDVFMPDGYKRSINNAIEFSTFLNLVRHAMYDDGDMCFVNVKNYGSFIVFAHQNEDHFNYVVETHLKKLDKTLKDNYERMHNRVKNTEDSILKKSYIKQLETMPKSIKELEYTYHSNVNLLIYEIEEHHERLLERKTKIDEKMKLLRK